MAKYFLATIGILCLLPMAALAAFNDVQFTEDTNIYLTGIPLTLVVSAGSQVESITVGTDSVSVDMLSGSTITFSSGTARKIMTASPAIATTVCSTSSSEITLAPTTTRTVTIAITGDCSTVGGGPAAPAAPPAPAVPTTTTGEVTTTAAAGGKTTLTTPEGIKATIELPAAAVTANTDVKVAQVSTATVLAAASAPTGKTLVSAFDLTAKAAGVAVTSFAKTVTVTFTYTDTQVTGLNVSTLKIYRWTGTQWVVLPTVVYPATKTLTATTTQFSYFAVMGELTAAAPEVPVVTPTVTVAQLKAQMITLIQQIIVLITQLITELQAQLAAMQT